MKNKVYYLDQLSSYTQEELLKTGEEIIKSIKKVGLKTKIEKSLSRDHFVSEVGRLLPKTKTGEWISRLEELCEHIQEKVNEGELLYISLKDDLKEEHSIFLSKDSAPHQPSTFIYQEKDFHIFYNYYYSVKRRELHAEPFIFFLKRGTDQYEEVHFHYEKNYYSGKVVLQNETFQRQNHIAKVNFDKKYRLNNHPNKQVKKEGEESSQISKEDKLIPIDRILQVYYANSFSPNSQETFFPTVYTGKGERAYIKTMGSLLVRSPDEFIQEVKNKQGIEAVNQYLVEKMTETCENADPAIARYVLNKRFTTKAFATEKKISQIVEGFSSSDIPKRSGYYMFFTYHDGMVWKNTLELKNNLVAEAYGVNEGHVLFRYKGTFLPKGKQFVHIHMNSAENDKETTSTHFKEVVKEEIEWQIYLKHMGEQAGFLPNSYMFLEGNHSHHGVAFFKKVPQTQETKSTHTSQHPEQAAVYNSKELIEGLFKDDPKLETLFKEHYREELNKEYDLWNEK